MFAVSRMNNQVKPPIKTENNKEIKQKIEDTPPKKQEGAIFRKQQDNSNQLKNIANISPPIEKSATQTEAAVPENKEIRRIKIKLSIIKDIPYSQKVNLSNANMESNADKKSLKKNKEMKMKHRRVNREGNFNCGRWQPEEHERFIEAIMKYGNEWKSVQKHVASRSSTQARSHAQKFFVKMKKANLLTMNLDCSKNSIKTLHEYANNMNSDEYFDAIKTLNCVAFERKSNSKRRSKKEDFNLKDSSAFSAESPSIKNLR